ncbi:hypothetical protein QE152_g897 [Popillia japonica]|uniref:Uncharacterized protein n=1 Tax=Popillia japonica TaxID=7064 RepID=A0AAW1NC04_POPJA
MWCAGGALNKEPEINQHQHKTEEQYYPRHLTLSYLRAVSQLKSKPASMIIKVLLIIILKDDLSRKRLVSWKTVGFVKLYKTMLFHK